MSQVPKDTLSAGNVGYIITGIKESKEIKVGDTITHHDKPCDAAIVGFEEVKPMVFAGIYPIENEDFEDLRDSLEKLQLNDASLVLNRNLLSLWDLVSGVVFRYASSRDHSGEIVTRI